MAPRLTCVWIAAALAVLLAGLVTGSAEAARISGSKRLDAQHFKAQVAFRFPGRGMGQFHSRRRSFGVRPGGGSKGIHGKQFNGGGFKRRLARAPIGAAGAGILPLIPYKPGVASGLANAPGRTRGQPPAAASPDRPSRASGGHSPPGEPPGRRPPYGGPGLVIVPGAVALGGAVAIMGAGGAPRPPIAPRYVGAPDQDPARVATALLDKKRHRPRELLAEVKPGTPGDVMSSIAQQYRVQIDEVGYSDIVGARLWRITAAPGQDLHTLLTALLQDRRLVSVQPNYVYAPVQGPAEGRPGSDKDGADAAPAPRRQAQPGAGVKLAVIDTCVDGGHSELQGSIADSFNAIQGGSGGAGCKPENHGTAIASLIAGHNQIRGVAQGASLLAVQAFSYMSEENGIAATSREILVSIKWAAKQGAQVMNLSFAGPADPLIEAAIAEAYRSGISLVAAAGNAGPDSPPLYPGAYPEVIAVTALDGRRAIYGAANRGKHIAVSARGVNVLAAHVNNTYGIESGTSFAAAEVSGIVASLLERRPKAGPLEVRSALQKTAAAVPGADQDTAGYGAVDQQAAVAFVEASLPQ